MKRYVTWLASSIWRIALLYICSLLLCAILMTSIEGWTFSNSLWYSSVTSLTVGYGDIFPTTTAGRIVAMLFAHFWIFGVAPLVVTNILNVSLEDRDKFSHDEQEEIKTLLREIHKQTKGD